MPKWVSSKTGHPEEAARVIAEAMSGAKKYNGPELLAALMKANDFSTYAVDERVGMQTTGNVVRLGQGASFDYIHALIVMNALNLPETEGEVRPDIRAFFYKQFGFSDPENAREAVDRVFEENQRDPSLYPTFGQFFTALIRANGFYNRGDEIPAKAMITRMRANGYSVPAGELQSLIVEVALNRAAPSYEFLAQLVDSDALGLRTDEQRQAQIDALFAKAGKTQWRQDTLQQRADDVLEAVRQGQITDIGKAFSKLLPHLSNKQIYEYMLVADPTLALRSEPKFTPDRVRDMMNGNVRVYPQDFNALFDIVLAEIGIGEQARQLLEGLEQGGRKKKTTDFTKAMHALAQACLPPHGAEPVNWAELVRCSQYPGEGRPRLASSTLHALRSGVNEPVVFETMRELVKAFERAYQHKTGDSPERLRPSIDAMLSFTPYRYDALFETPDQIIARHKATYFAPGEGYQPLDPKRVALNKLLAELRTAVGVEVGQGDFASRLAPRITPNILQNYETGTIFPPAENIQLMMNELQNILAQHHAPPISEAGVREFMGMVEAYREQWEQKTPDDKAELRRRESTYRVVGRV